MGLSYNYEIITERDSADRLIRALCDHVQPDDRSRLLAALLPSQVSDVMVNVKRCHEDFGRIPRRHAPICLCFLFAEDGPMTEYTANQDCRRFEGRIAVGCVWTSIEFGSQFVVIRAHAATSDMSRLFAASPSVRATFCAIGSAGGALLVTFDEEENVTAVWPWQGRLAASNEVDEFLDDELHVKVDAYCAERIARATLKRPAD